MNDGYNGVWWGGMGTLLRIDVNCLQQWDSFCGALVPGVFGPAAMYQLWGDPADLLPHYSAMRAFVDYLNVTCKAPSFLHLHATASAYPYACVSDSQPAPAAS